MDSMRFVEMRSDDGVAATFVTAMKAEVEALYDGLVMDAPTMPSAGPADLGPPGGAFLVGFSGDDAVCCGGLKRLDDTACEIKRMYVVPAHRGQGVARVLLDALESRARTMGYRVARLDTGPRQASAQRIYESAGYQPIGNFNANPVASYWGEKSL